MKRLALVILAASSLALAAAGVARAESSIGGGPTGVTSNKPARLLVEILQPLATFRATVDYTALKSGQTGTFVLRHCPTTWDACASDTDESYSTTGGTGTTHLEIDLLAPHLGQWEQVFSLAGSGKVTAQITDYYTQ